jgi:hypothetical protein
MVGQADLDWNLLLGDLSKLSVIVENHEEEISGREEPAAPILRQKHVGSNRRTL